MTEPYLGPVAGEMKAKAKRVVAEHFRGAGKDKEAVLRLLQKQIEGRHDPLSKAIQAELDARK